MTEQLKPFEREQRYVVFKLADMRRFLTFDEIQAIHVAAMKLAAYRHQAGKPDLECVVVESDWPEYEPTWQAIEARTSGALTTSQPAQAGEVAGQFALDKHGVWHMLPPGSTSGTTLYTHPAPGVPVTDADALLDFMEAHRVSVTPEYEGQWCARQYDDEPQAVASEEGATPRDALRALAAAQAKGGESA